MKKIVVIAIIIACSTSYAQNTKIRTTIANDEYKNVFYRSPQKYNKQEQPFKVSAITFHTSYKGAKSEHIYQISVDGRINNKTERVLYRAKSIEEMEYYKKVFKGKYKKILLYEYDDKVGPKTYYDTSIVVEF